MTEKQRKIKVVMRENSKEAQVVDAETGENLAYVTAIHIRIDKTTQFRPIATLEFYDPEIEIEANTEVETTKAYRRLE